MCQLRAFVTFELFGSTQKVDYRYKAYEKYYHFDHIIVFQLWRLHEWQIYDFWSYNLVLLFLRLGLTFQEYLKQDKEYLAAKQKEEQSNSR